MSLTLGIDCTLRRTNVGLAADGRVLAELNADIGREQAGKLPELVARLLELTNHAIHDVTRVAVTVGPGYYTGMRIGIAYACALAEALGVPAVPIPTPYALVRDLLPLSLPIAAVIRARRDFVYAAIYLREGEGHRELLIPSYLEARDFVEEMKKHPSALIVGRDALHYPSIPAAFPLILPRAAAHGGQVALSAGDAAFLPVSPAQIHGNYLREPDIGGS